MENHVEAADETEDSPAVIGALRRLHAATAPLIDARISEDATVAEARDRLGVGNQLAWTLLNFRRASSVSRMVRFLPGRRGWQSFKKAFEDDAGMIGPLERVRTALAEFQRICDEETIDLSALAEPAGAAQNAEAEGFRREQYLKHRGTWPVRAQAKIVASLFAPDPSHREMGSMANVMMLLGLEGTPAGPTLEVARALMPEDELQRRLPPGTDLGAVFGNGGSLPPLLEEFSSPGVVGRELHRMESDGGLKRVGFGGTDPKRTTPLTLAFGQLMPRLGPLLGDSEDRAICAAETPGPVEWCLLDAIWPKDLPAGGPWEARLSSYSGPGDAGSVNLAATFPPLIEALDSTRLEAISLPGIMKSMTPNYRRALKAAAAALGRTLEEFEIHRTALRYSLPRTSIVASRLLAPTPHNS